MKLTITEEVPCDVCPTLQGLNGVVCPKCMGTKKIVKSRDATHADLQALKLAALETLKELEDWLERSFRAGDIVYAIKSKLKSLESQHFSALADLKKILVQAEAWKIVSDLNRSPIGLVVTSEMKEKILTEARRSLGIEENKKKDQGD